MVKKLLKSLKTNSVLILICLLFFVTRLYKITEIPSSVYWDEASIGYNAYSVLKTGKDEWGETLPLHFRAFGEFKLPVYVYSVVVSEFVFGMNIMAVRLPAVMFGLAAVVGLYLVVLEITKKKEVALLSSFLFTMTPWFFIFSRTGYEATAGLSFFIYALYFLLISGRNSINFFISILLFITSAYSYNSFRILTPLVLVPFLVYLLFKRKFVMFFISMLVLLASTIPLYKLYRQDSGLSRLQAVKSTTSIVTNYIKNFSPSYLFINGDSNLRSQMKDQSQLYYLDAVFILLGMIYILKSNKLSHYLILGLLLIAPIPAAITKENPHALRTILMSPVLSIISATGIYYLSENYKRYKILIFRSAIAVYLLFFGNYFYKFNTEYNNDSLSAWQYEYKDIFTNQKEGCVTDEYAQPYIFALFYNKIDPNDFIETRMLNPVSDWGFSTVASFGDYTFPKICQTK